MTRPQKICRPKLKNKKILGGQISNYKG